MKNPFRTRTPKQAEAKVVEVLDNQLIRWFLFDSGLPNIEAIEGCLGLMPTSEDGKSIEIEASNKRIQDVAGFEYLAREYSTMAAQVWATYFLHQQGLHVGEDPEADASAAAQVLAMSAVAYTTLVGFLAAYRNLGIVAVGDGEQR